jgi:hypothetical protein
VFIAGIPQLIDGSTVPDVLNLFISSLRDQNCVISKYSGNSAGDMSSAECRWNTVTGEGKVNAVCSVLREEMLRKCQGDLGCQSQLLLPILTSYARQQPPLLESALQFVLEDAKQKGYTLVSPHVQRAIKYLAFLVSADELFDAALGKFHC